MTLNRNRELLAGFAFGVLTTVAAMGLFGQAAPPDPASTVGRYTTFSGFSGANAILDTSTGRVLQPGGKQHDEWIQVVGPVVK